MAPDASPPQPLHVAIIGAGIAGLTLALGLLKRDIHVTVYERQQSLREIGAGIGFTANAERAMLALHPEIRASFKRVAVQNGSDWFRWRDGLTGDLIHEMYLGERGFEGCLRADFLEELAKLLPEGIVEFGKDVIDLEEDEDGVRLVFADGSTIHADVVVGCDGLRSPTRQLVFGAGYEATYTHKHAFRGLIPMPQAQQVLGEERSLTRNMYLGPDAHALTFPVAGGTLLNFVAFATDRNPWPHAERLTAPATQSEAAESFANFSAKLRELVGLLPEQLDKWAVFDLHDHPLPTFSRGRLCLAGDAAHAAAPYHGAGAGFAIEDAVVLAELLQMTSGKGVPAALEAYAAIRIERARWLVESSRYLGRLYQWQDETVGSDHVKCAKEIEWRSRRIWDHDIEEMVERAKEIFRTGRP